MSGIARSICRSSLTAVLSQKKDEKCWECAAGVEYCGNFAVKMSFIARLEQKRPTTKVTGLPVFL